MALQRFGRMLPWRDASQQQLAILQTFFAQPMLLSNAELGQTLRLGVLNRNDFRRFSDDLNNKPSNSLIGALQRYLQRSYLSPYIPQRKDSPNPRRVLGQTWKWELSNREPA
ncbi:hypothetical protein BDW59DRAFT_89744 [Aspergillus cavernicola]|uniref:Uncharacterized protein n=1 Tax=Aspergillus cavernicola TaxID=176166 RepID=A0ABR4I8C4_9EURO